MQMFVDLLEKSVVEDALAKIGKSLGFSLKHSTLDADQGRARVGSPLWWWYEYEPSSGEDGKNVAGTVFLFHFGTCQTDYGLKSHYIESTSMLEDVLTTREFIVCNRTAGSRHALPTRISNPFAGARSLEELQMKLDLLGGGDDRDDKERKHKWTDGLCCQHD